MQATNNAARATMPVPPPGTMLMAGVRVVAAYAKSFEKDGKTIEYAKVEIEVPSMDPDRMSAVRVLSADPKAIPKIAEAMRSERPVYLLAELVDARGEKGKSITALRVHQMLDLGA